MGRELYRVPLDFDWPLNKPWSGFINPHYKPCPEDQKTCFHGITAGALWLETVTRLMCMIAEDARTVQGNGMPPHPYLTSMGSKPTYDVPAYVTEGLEPGRARMAAVYRYCERRTDAEAMIRPSNDFLQIMDGLLGAPESPAGFDSYRDYKLYFKLLETAGLPKGWGTCPVCKGDHLDPAVADVYHAWTRTPPPSGSGWQLWETVSEGSPISPVFETQEFFIQYLVQQGYSLQAATAFSEEGWAPSMVIAAGKIKKDIESLGSDTNT